MAERMGTGHWEDNQNDVLETTGNIGEPQEVSREQSEAQPRLEEDSTYEALNVNILNVLSLSNLKSLALENKGPVARDHVCFCFLICYFFFPLLCDLV